MLSGVKSVTLHDDAPAQLRDLSSQFFLREEDVAAGRTRADATQPRLAELNTYVPVQVHKGALTEDVLANYSVIVLTNSSLAEQRAINNYARANSKAFIAADSKGLFG